MRIPRSKRDWTMSSATLTRRRAESGSSGAGVAPQALAEPRQPYSFFLVAGILLAVAAIVVLRGQDPASVSIVALTLVAAGLTGVALFQVLAPLTSARKSGSSRIGSRRRAALERDKSLTLRSIKELEFDRAMGKVSEADFVEMRDRLRARAVRLMRQLEGAGLYRQMIERDLGRSRRAAIPSVAPTPSVDREGASAAEPDRQAVAAASCLGCGTANDLDARFCKRCGERLPWTLES
jgi:hypothetical protein